ncbi:Phosphoenolpyruvate/pyruvate domain-containing protein [Rhizodiscina lignyota]|uniref:Phosphoenolpyruvate/pyruvate domain-containing protein n=1 Tax=Rhizodiscina lignyota TaxID=1504668 RepID=A0A9P4M8Z8_9PEZI|nr:Phosphoenolpyruvate/pyruvate domain-containing protein [Rhizodiscina lignyota]
MASTGTNGARYNPKPAAARLREMLARPDSLVACPGVYDGLSARIMLREGFDCLYMALRKTGAGTAASKLGMPDLGIITLNDILENASMIASLDRTVPVIADADTGYGGPIMVARTVKSYIQAGVAGLHIEDQVQSKRCGHLAGKELVDPETYYARIRAAVLGREEMRSTTGGDIVIIARTDSLQSLGYEEALLRLKKCIEIGADVAFLEGPTSLEQMKQACQELAPAPVLLNAVPGGVTPHVSQEEAKKLGYKIMIYPAISFEAAYQAIWDSAKELKQTKDIIITERQKKEGVKAVFGVCGLMDCVEFDKKAGGQSYNKGV